jgi:hypothetical protein
VSDCIGLAEALLALPGLRVLEVTETLRVSFWHHRPPAKPNSDRLATITPR